MTLDCTKIFREMIRKFTPKYQSKNLKAWARSTFNIKKHRKILFIIWLLLLLFSKVTNAQGEANIWYFGENAGLDFNSGSPVALQNGQSTGWEGTSSMCDAAGQLLFYTDGKTVWNRNQDTLLNGYDLLGEYSATQAALIIPKPGSDSKYYIFTTESVEDVTFPIPTDEWKLSYSELDMSLDGGLGGITSIKNVVLYSPVQEKLTAVKHANNEDIWLLAHDMFTNKYLSYLVTNQGVNPIPIITEAGSVDTTLTINGNPLSTGYMKASPDGNNIAAVFNYAEKVDLLRFNKATGHFNYRFTFDGVVERPYGLEFSPNSEILYVSGDYPSSVRQFQIEQFDNLADVISNSVEIYNNPSFPPWALQLGPDQKIYAVSFGRQFIHQIENPNAIGLSSNFIQDFLFLGGPFTRLGLPNFFSEVFYSPQILSDGLCAGDSVFFTAVQGNLADSVLWHFGDLAIGSPFQSEGIEVYHIYNQPGVYEVRAYLFNGVDVDTIHYTVYVTSAPVIDLGPNLWICPSDTLTIGTNDYPWINWQDGSLGSEFNVNNPGIYTATAENDCGLSMDSVLVSLRPPIDVSISISDCKPVSINDITYNSSGTYVQTFQGVSGCDSILTIEAEILNFNAQIFQTDTTLYYNGNPTSIQWINCSTGQAIPGANQVVFVPQQTGNYGAIITIGECVDTSNCNLIPVPPIPKSPPDICENIDVFPNPVIDQVSFSLDKVSYSINLFSSTGALVWQKAGTPEKQEIDFRNYAPAMYVLQVDQCRFKIVKQ
jgi:hypothetical protein